MMMMIGYMNEDIIQLNVILAKRKKKFFHPSLTLILERQTDTGNIQIHDDCSGRMLC